MGWYRLRVWLSVLGILVWLAPRAMSQGEGDPLSVQLFDEEGSGENFIVSAIEPASGDDFSLLPIQNGSVNVETFSGAATMSIPINVPQSRGGVTPSISINYSSNSKQNLAGYGWSLDLGSISRSAQDGVPSYTSSDEFVAEMNGSSQKLVYDPSAGFYRAKTEGTFLRTEFSGNSWVVTDKTGKQYFYGSDAGSREYDPGNPSRISSWKLDKILDVHGNYSVITYTRDGNTLYPAEIAYSYHEPTGLAAYARITFDYESRSDRKLSYRSGYRMEHNLRLNEINVLTGGELQRTYAIEYTMSPFTDRSLLSKVTQIAPDGSALPSVTFMYQGGRGFIESASEWNIPVQAAISDSTSGYPYYDLGVRFIDFDQDGYTDFMKSFWGPNGQLTNVTFRNSRQDGWAIVANGWGHPLPENKGSLNVQRISGMGLLDINGDGAVDIVKRVKQIHGSRPWPEDSKYGSFINNRTDGWLADNAQWHLPEEACLNIGSIRSFFGDIDGDGYADIVDYRSSSNHENDVYINEAPNGAGWALKGSLELPHQIEGDLRAGAQLVDLNGDGLPDIFYTNGSSRHIWMNIGNGWSKDNSSPWLDTFGIGNFTDGSTQMADINGDGLADVLVAKGGFSQGSRVLINTGSGWKRDDAWVIPGGKFEKTRMRLFDADGNGLLDAFRYESGGTPHLYINEGVVPDLLASISNGLGAVSELSYAPSSVHEHTYLPFVMNVVSSQTITFKAEAYTTSYMYEDGLWDISRREFRGFGRVRVTAPEGSYSETDHLQGEFDQGRVAEQRMYSSQGEILSKTVNTWESEVISPGSEFVFLRRKDNFLYNAGDTMPGKRTAEEYFYDEPVQYGNLTRTLKLGEVDVATGADIGNDRFSDHTEYVHNTDGWLIGFPKTTYRRDNNGNIISQAWMYYDGQANVAPPVKGLLTRRVDWGGAGNPNPENTFEHDSFGNVTAVTDALGRRSESMYDPAARMFVIETRNALDHTARNVYYGINAQTEAGFAGLWGQVKSAVDINGQTTRHVYDTFGRRVRSISPMDSLGLPTEETEYIITDDHTVIKSSRRVKSGGSVVITSYAFTDGLGRAMYSKSPSAQAGQYVVSGMKTYNSRGMPEKAFLPYFSTRGPLELESVDLSRPFAETVYDERGRVVRVTNPDGTYSSMAYDLWTHIITDENGHKQESDFDAYGRLIEKREYEGADGRFPAYPQDNYALYSTTQFDYDNRGNLLKTIDDHGNETVLTYDALGRKISMNDPDMGFWTYAYDLNGNLRYQADANGHVIEFAYDELNRLKRKFDSAGLDVTYTYDDPAGQFTKGRMTRSVYNTVEDTDFVYDELGREVEAVKTINGQDHTVERNYDALNNLINIQYPDGEKVYYDFNDAGQIRGVANDPAVFQESKVSCDWLCGALGFLEEVVFGVKPAYAQNITSPSNGSVLAGSSVTFLWSTPIGGPAITDYFLGVSTHLSGLSVYPYGNIFAGSVSSGSQQVTGIPLDGNPVYVRLWYKIDGVWSWKDYTYSTALPEVTPPEISSPAPGNELGSSEITFSWTPGQGIQGYFLGVATSQVLLSASPYGNIFAGSTGTATSQAVTGIPLNGDNVYVRLWYQSTAGQWLYDDYTYGTADAEVVEPELNYPAPGTKIAAQTVTFSWSAGSSISEYFLGVGSSSGAVSAAPWGDIFAGNTGTVTAKTVSGIPLNGNNFYVRLWYKAGGVWSHSDYAYQTINTGSVKPQLNSPAAGELIDSETLTFTWSGPAGYDAYFLGVGTSFEAVSSTPWGDIAASNTGESTSLTVSGIPLNGEPVYVRLWYFKNGIWENADYSFDTSGGDEPDGISYVDDIRYNAAGRITRIAYGNGVVTDYEYDPLNQRLTRIHSYNGGGVILQDLRYTYDGVGNILRIDDLVNTADQVFEYDALNRLVSARNPSGYGVKTYRYDAIGNILEKDGKVYSYDDMSHGNGGGGPHAVTSLSDGTTFTYDANGNMLSKQKPGEYLKEFAYDAENRLVKVTLNGAKIADFTYDGDGGRQLKQKYDPDGGFDGRIIFVGELYEAHSQSSTSRGHIFAGDRRVASLNNGEVHYYLADHLGSTNVVTDADGNRVELVEYEPYGTISRKDVYGADPERIADYYFTNQYRDEESGLYFYNARYYDPEIGRFITPDTFVPDPSGSQGFNRYTYVYNNPISFNDPSGNFPWFAAAIGGLIGAVSGGISAHRNGGSIWQGVLFGGLQGFGAGVAFGTGFESFAKHGYGWQLTQASGGLSLASQVAGAAGNEQLQQNLMLGAQALGGLYLGINIGKGIKDWAYEHRFGFYSTDGYPVSPASGDSIHINGIATDLSDALLEGRTKFDANVLGNNPASGPVADLTESFLEKVTFTSSVTRQIRSQVNQLNSISLSGFSQGGMIASNVAFGLGRRGYVNVLNQLRVFSTQVSQPRVYYSGGLAGLGKKFISYGVGSPLDFSNALGPNIIPTNFVGGLIGVSILPIGIRNHYAPKAQF